MIFDAKQARANIDATRSIDGPYLRKETDDLLKILEEVSHQADSYTFCGTMDGVIYRRLDMLGFDMRSFDADQRDPYDLGGVVISW